MTLAVAVWACATGCASSSGEAVEPTLTRIEISQTGLLGTTQWTVAADCSATCPSSTGNPGVDGVVGADACSRLGAAIAWPLPPADAPGTRVCAGTDSTRVRVSFDSGDVWVADICEMSPDRYREIFRALRAASNACTSR